MRQSRQAAGLSLRQLAARVGYDHSYLSQVERGQRPGSADLARLCDRELGTDVQLTATFEQSRTGRPPVRTADPLEAAWQGLTSALGVADQAVVLGDFRSVPPSRILPELLAALQIHIDEAGQLSVLIAETLTALGDPRSAKRWWWAARGVADRTDEVWLSSVVRAREVLSGLAERRPLPQLLELADEAVARAAEVPSGSMARAHAARACVLAELGRSEEARRALQDLIGVTDALPSGDSSYGPLGDWTPYQARVAEGQVCATLGYRAAGCLLTARALELCPKDWLDERARLEMRLAECLAIDGDGAAGVALALRVLIELPDEWHTYYLYDAATRVLSVVQDREPRLASTCDLRALIERRVYLSSQSVGGGSWISSGRG